MRYLILFVFTILVATSLLGQNRDSLAKGYAMEYWKDTLLDYRQENLEKFHELIRLMADSDQETLRKADYVNYVGDSTEDFHLYTYSFRVHSGYYQYFMLLDYKGESAFIEQLDQKKKSLDTYENYELTSWYGALYYNIIPKKIKSETYYFLLGFRDLDHIENEKIMDILYQRNGAWVLGKSGFFENEKARFSLSYSEQAKVKLNYDETEDMILYDHLIMRQHHNRIVYLPDGSYQGLKWKKKKWIIEEKIHSEVSEEVPRPQPILEARNKDIFGN